MDKTEKRVAGYSSVLIAIAMSSAKLLAIRENSIVARYWHFDLAELSFQMAFNLAFCYLLFYLNIGKDKTLSVYRQQKRYVFYFLINALIVLAAIISGSLIQRLLFGESTMPGGIVAGYIGRLFVSGILVAIIIKLILLMRESKNKEIENEQLKNAYMLAELELLKEQMNPHFLFNSLSSLSGVIREDADKAQKYVHDLSNVFRYALTRSKVNMVSVAEELAMLRSFAELIHMRLETAFQMEIDIPEPFMNYHLPHLSLQPLLENAVKHNMATIAKPLLVHIYIEGEHIVMSNNLQPVPVPESSTGLGLANLNERFKFMTRRDIEIIKTDEQFVVKLPVTHG